MDICDSRVAFMTENTQEQKLKDKMQHKYPILFLLKYHTMELHCLQLKYTQSTQYLGM